ncbi:hypothetical protein EVAR_71705_1 [Eumeta japonica]|uniref:Uncharacterized protein n=1 Tax=Eumeta variegata TaxID=151549 RepID=A0A4C1T0H6_EUMVA|nr:hypothetical protein EVAR_71705_1 [Eumeta japonica]
MESELRRKKSAMEEKIYDGSPLKVNSLLTGLREEAMRGRVGDGDRAASRSRCVRGEASDVTLDTTAENFYFQVLG